MKNVTIFLCLQNIRIIDKKYNLEKKINFKSNYSEKILNIQSFQNEEKSQFKIFLLVLVL